MQQALTEKICSVLDNKKAQNIVIIDIHQQTVIADAFIIASGRSSIQVQALSDDLEETLESESIRTLRREGYREGRWVVLDYGDVMVHIFHEEERRFYNLERLWGSSGNTTEYLPRD